MNNLFQLIRNEQMKMYSQISTWIMFGILALFIIGFGVFMKVNDSFTNNPAAAGDDWKQELQAENEDIKKSMQENAQGGGDFTPPQLEENQYRIEHNIKPRTYDVWSFIKDNKNNISIISLFTIIVAAGAIANEFKWGTIKLLLIRPISRTKILLAKYLSVLIFALTMLIFLYVLSFITGSALFGIDGLSQTYLFKQAGEFKEAPIFQHTVFQYLLGSVNLLMMATFAFMISSVFRNSSLAIGVAIFLMMSGNAIVAFLSTKDWAKYILFANTDLTTFFEGTPIIEDLTLPFSVTVLAVYFILFVGLAWGFFTKRDVAST
ncbi:ABC transporter permease [Halobacillus salinarum]|uniref:ABC transporter permease n=1 Tax=Halobacillus salinarum TaxID=2932257 RepID=A0ABY4EK50_9BACI|nr:ABC transporter permease [Halobacillus salinarum]UOQ44476.1 ABC transporter permease [Halobacillus salinarum]